MFSRTKLLIGEGLQKLQNSHVIVFGVGGVGGYVCEMLVRAGVGELTIVDFDVVDESNINRQIIALHSTVGREKTQVMAERLKDINPDLKLHTINQKYTAENREEFFTGRYDYVVDAIDIVTDKIDLIVSCHQRNLNIVSAMGAGNRYCVPEFKVSDIYKTYNDGLAKIMRKKLKENDIKKHDVVFTDNLPDNNGRTVGSISYYPSMCGCVIAGFVVNQLLKN